MAGMRFPADPRFALCVMLSACTGLFESPLGSDVGNARSGDGPGDTPDPNDPGIVIGSDGEPLDCAAKSAAPAPLSRLTRAQYARTVSDLLKVDASAIAATFPSDESTNGFDVGLSVSPLLAEAYEKSAEELATTAVKAIDKLVPCDPKTGEEACARTFVTQFSRRAFRRAVPAPEVDALMALYTAGRTDADFASGIELVLEAMLSSPSFLYHVDELAEDGKEGVASLSAFSLASRLSYLVWGSTPDDALLEAAEKGALASEAGLLAEAERMLKSRPDAAKLGFREFYQQWLGLSALDNMERDLKQFPDYDRAQGQALRASLEQQIDHTVWERDGDLAELLLSQEAFVNERTASVFGVSVTGAENQSVTLPAEQRRGLLTHPALLASLSKPNQSDPVIRGKFVRERMLCQHLPPPPADVAIIAPDPAPGLTTRERFSEHSSNPACVGCHRLMDPIGFGLEHFDALGRYRADEQGLTIDARGEILDGKDASATFDGAVELAEALAASDEVASCVATQFFRYAVARTETDADLCSLAKVESGFIANDKSLRGLILEVVKSDAFRLRPSP